jgi:CheY-like chemotaxis protein
VVTVAKKNIRPKSRRTYTGRPSILIVGDVGEAVLTAFEREGFDVHLACDGVEVFAAFAAGCSPHVILLDMRIPETMDRSVLATLSASEFADLPVVVLSHFEEIKEDPRTKVFVQRSIDPAAIRRIVEGTQENFAPWKARSPSAPPLAEFGYGGGQMQPSIMVVEDDDDHRAALVDVLEEAGYNVVIATHGREALTELELRPPPSLIVLDMMMPVLDGWGFMEEFKRDPSLSSIPVVVVSTGSRAMFESIPAASGYLHKPLDAEKLLGTIRACLGDKPRASHASDPGPLS